MVRYITFKNSLMVIARSEVAKKRAEVMSEIYYGNLRQTLILLSKTENPATATGGGGDVLYTLYVLFFDSCFSSYSNTLFFWKEKG